MHTMEKYANMLIAECSRCMSKTVVDNNSQIKAR